MEKYKGQLKYHPVTTPYCFECASMAALHCFRKHGSSLLSLPLLLVGREKDKVLGSLAGRALTE